MQITLNSAESGVSCTGIQSSASNYSVDVRFWAISMSVNHPCQGCHFKRVSNLLNETLPTFQINTQNFFSPVPFRWALTITLFSLWKFIQQQETVKDVIVIYYCSDEWTATELSQRKREEPHIWILKSCVQIMNEAGGQATVFQFKNSLQFVKTFFYFSLFSQKRRLSLKRGKAVTVLIRPWKYDVQVNVLLPRCLQLILFYARI